MFYFLKLPLGVNQLVTKSDHCPVFVLSCTRVTKYL